MNAADVSIIDHMRRRTNESGIILNWFLKVGVTLLVLAVIGFDVGSIVVNNFSLSSSADDVAVAVSIGVSDNPSTFFTDFQIYEMAVDVVSDETNGVAGARVVRKGTHIDDEGIVHVRLRRKADTLVTHLIGPLEKTTIAVVDGQAGTN